MYQTGAQSVISNRGSGSNSSTYNLARHQQVVKMPLPTYSGHGDENSAADFIIKFEKYSHAVDIPLHLLLHKAMPCALTDTAYTW
jgi:hypothetical protein